MQEFRTKHTKQRCKETRNHKQGVAGLKIVSVGKKRKESVTEVSCSGEQDALVEHSDCDVKKSNYTEQLC